MLSNTAVRTLSLLVTLDAILLAEAFNTFWFWLYMHTPTHCHESITANAHVHAERVPLTGTLKPRAFGRHMSPRSSMSRTKQRGKHFYQRSWLLEKHQSNWARFSTAATAIISLCPEDKDKG